MGDKTDASTTSGDPYAEFRVRWQFSMCRGVYIEFASDSWTISQALEQELIDKEQVRAVMKQEVRIRQLIQDFASMARQD